MISASYFDGRTARLHAVDLELGSDTIGVAGHGIAKTYPCTQVRMGEPFADSPCVLDFPDGARCEVSDPGDKLAVARALDYRKSRVQRLQQHWYGALLSLVLLLAAIGSGVQWGIPALAERIVAAMPPSVDQGIGDQAMRALDQQMFRETHLSDQRVAEIQAIFRNILPPTTRVPITLRVVAMRGGQPNALALPNGTIVVNDAMVKVILERGDFDDDSRAALAGVLAHEIGHVEGRHSMRAVARSSLLALGAGTLFGDFSTVIAGAPVVLLNLDYSRDMESAADEYAIARLAATGQSPKALADLFDSLEQLSPGASKLPKWLTKGTGYLSSHPANGARSARFRAAAQGRTN